MVFDFDGVIIKTGHDQMMHEERLSECAPRVSVIMSVYNHQNYVAEAIKSVLAQTYGDLELIILDNGSTDKSLSVIRSFIDKRIILLHEANNITAYWGVQKCFSQSKGSYIAFIGSDDIWDPKKLQSQVGYLEANSDTKLVFTETKMIDGDGTVLDWTPFLSADYNMSRYAWLRHFFFFSNCVCWPSCLMDRRLMPPATSANARFRQLGDLYMWTLALQASELYIFPEVLTYYRQHGENESQKNTILLHNRSNLESFYILSVYNSFDLEMLKLIFPEIASENSINIHNKNFYLAKLALSCFPDAGNIKSRRLFGIKTIFDLYSIDSVVNELLLAENFTLEEFYRFTGTTLNLSQDQSIAPQVTTPKHLPEPAPDDLRLRSIKEPLRSMIS